MNPARGATPDSDAVASSEDERPWPSSTSFGKFPMNENSVPGLPGGIWSTQKRSSFKMAEAQRNAALEVRLGASGQGHNALRPGTTPSPSAKEGATSLPFSIPLQPIPKLGRSLSHSQGQREFPLAFGPHSGGALPLGLLAEEVDTESEPELGERLTHTTSHPPVGAALRHSTFPLAYDTLHNGGNGKGLTTDFTGGHPGQKLDRRFETAFQELTFDPPQRRSQWQSSLGWDDVPNVNESRRHSLADIPTRRGSLVGGGESGQFAKLFLREADTPDMTTFPGFNQAENEVDDDEIARNARSVRADAFGIPAMYRAPHLRVEGQDTDARRNQQQIAGTGLQWGPNGGRPRKQLYLVSFKCSRVEVFYLLDNTGLTVKDGDLVIVEADRGQDLGTVQHAKISPELVRDLKRGYSEEQYRWLMMYSRNKDGGNNPNAQLHGESNSGNFMYPDASNEMISTLPRDEPNNNLKPKAIKRLASEHEIRMLAEKEGNEAKAKRTCQQKVAHLRLEMEILDAEWQWDFQKLIFYYYSDKYINFKDLVTELYRIYKTRIWMSAINPASYSQGTVGQAPSGIGPGAVAPYNTYNLNQSYTMAYGEDRDPYGAQMPYRIPFDTYTPNYPAIPGIPNSFAPGHPQQQMASNPYMYYPGSQNSNMSSVPPQLGVQGAGGADMSAAGSSAMYNPRPAYGRAQDTDQQRRAESGMSSPTGGVPLPVTSLNAGVSHNAFPQIGLWNATPFQPSQARNGAGRKGSFQSPIGTRSTALSTPGGHDTSTGEEQKQQQAMPWELSRAGLQSFDSTGISQARSSVSGSSHSSVRRTTLSQRLENMNLQAGASDRIDSHNRVRNVDRYLTSLPSPDQFRND